MPVMVVPPHLLQDRSTYRLTQVAKRVAIPRGIVGTDWGPVAETCRDDLGIEFDGWQDGMGQLMLARATVRSLDDGGMLAHTIGGFHLAACRQIGKTYYVAGSFFGLCQHYPGLLLIWTAHHTATSDETFEAIQGFAARTRVAPHIEFVHTGSGDEEVRFWNGSRILFGARERGFGRGIPGVDGMMFDEGQIMSQKAMQNMIATLNTSWLGLHVYAGTPPATEEIHKAESWMRSRDEAWVIEDPSVIQVETEDLVWVEFGADDTAELDDPEQWVKANPSFPHRTPIQAFQRLRRKLNDEGFRREGLGLYDEDEGSIFNLSKWKTLNVTGVEQPSRAALTLDVSPDRRWSSIGIASAMPASSTADEERALVMVMSIRDTAGAVAKIVELDTTRDLIDISITPGAARALETTLTKAGIGYEILTAAEVGAAYGNLQEAIKNGTVAHLDQSELNFALANAKSRYLQTGESESFDRRGYSVDVSPAVAVAGALYRWGLLDSPIPFIG